MPAAGRPALASSPTMLPLKSLSSRALKRFPTMQRFLAKQDSKTNRASLEVAPDKPLAYADRKWSTLQVRQSAAPGP